ncbi:MAG: hypothetical protein IME93_03215 [Proteobacteria bacterium]|nr:hypothetical protein [Pseudomonadota bacterium]
MKKLLLIALLFIGAGSGSLMADDIVLLIVPQNTNPDNLPKPVAETMETAGAVRLGTSDILPGTRVFNGKKLAAYKVDDVDILILESMISYHGLVWSIVGQQSGRKVDENGNPSTQRAIGKASILDYMADVVTYDENGTEISRVRPTDVTSLPRFLGHSPWQFSP